MITWIRSRIDENIEVIGAIAARSWSFVAGPVNIFIIAHWMSADEQGYYYTFGSLIALQVFVDMGLSYVSAQFISHEFSNLKWGERGEIVGDNKSLARIWSIISCSAKWYSLGAIGGVPLLIASGFYIFHEGVGSVAYWFWPWISYVIFAMANLFFTPFIALIEGSGRVHVVNKLRLYSAIGGSLLAWSCMVFGFGLFAPVFTSAVTFFVMGGYWLVRYPVAVRSFINSRTRIAEGDFSFRREMWPMVWRISLSWMSGYFIFQLYAPVLFKNFGPAEAGKMGMTMNVIFSIGQVGIAILMVFAPMFGKLIAERNWQELDRVFLRVLKISSMVLAFISICFAVTVWFLKAYDFSLGRRFVDFNSLLILIIAMLVNHLIASWAIYLRAHKKEPLLFYSIIGAIFSGFGILTFGPVYGIRGMALIGLMINLFYGLPTTYYVWTKQKKLWRLNYA